MPPKFPLDKETEENMLLFFSDLDEKQQRLYLALEAKKLGHGSINYLSSLFKVSEKRISRGISELEKKSS